LFETLQRKKNIMKSSTLVFAALVAFTGFAGNQVRADSMASIAIAPATGKVTLTPRWSIGGNLSGFHFMAQDLSLTGGASNEFYSTKSTAIPSGGDITAFTFYVPGSGAATNHADIGSKLTPNSYSALTSADPDLGYGSVQLYFIHHKTDGDYFTHIVPSSGAASAVADLKPMSQPGGPATGGASGYFGLTFSAANLGDGANMFYYLRNDTVTNTTRFGAMSPALAGASTDKFNLGINGHNALAFTGTDVGFGINKMYFQRLDPVTGFTIIGTLDPVSGRASDIANLGSVYSTLTFVPGDVGFGVNNFYTTGAVNATWQSVSFAAIADRLISAGSFTVTPTASSTLAIALTVVPGSAGAASISGPVAGVFTITPTAPGLITLQATQAGQAGSFEYNMLRQSFTASGAATLAITSQPTAQSAVTGTTATFSVTASGTTAVTYQWRKAGANISGNASATTSTLSLTNVQAADAASYDVAVTNVSGTILSNAVTLTVTTAAPVITNSPLTAGGTVGTAFSFTIVASGSPTSYTATPLPAGLSIAGATGVISGSPTAVGTTSVLLGATNGTGTGNATLTITVAAAGVAPVITNSPLTAAGTNGTPFSFTITASGSPTSYSASPLPAGLSIVASTGVITGTPTATGTTSVVLGATNATGTGNATLTITVAAAGTAPIITNSPLTAAGTTGVAFSYTITASGSPTSYSATPLPAGLSIVALTGVITGTPTTVGTTSVLLGATNGSGTGNATLTITVAAAGTAPVITSSSVTAAATSGTPFSYTITASGVPTSYSASPLPAGLSIVTATGVITGTPTTVGTTVVLLGATNSSGTGNYALTITVSAAGTVPDITNNPLTAAGTVGAAFTFTITATGTPTSYAASGLPVGLVLNTVTGVITGTPALAGTAAVPLSATNAFGTDSATLSITIAAATVAPVITIPPTIPATVGAPITYVIVATGLPTSYTATGLPIGLTLNPLTGAITGTPTIPGTYTVVITATNAAGTSTVTFTIVVAPATVAPVITSPTTATGTVGTPLITYLIAATGLPTSYSASGLPAGLKVNPLTGAINGTPTVAGTFTIVLTATNSAGTSTATLTLTIAATPASRIVNFSARAVSGPGSQTLIVGFVVTGDGKNLMVRGIGPTLATFGVVNALADPMLSLFGSDGSVFASNDDWQTNLNGPSNGALIASVGAQVGAFALPNGSKDSALLATFNNGAHTTSMVRPNSTTGVALTEIYDIDTSSNSRLINVSARMNVTVGEGTLIAGLVIAGNTPKTVLVRGVGPTLSAFAVAGVLADPQISVYSGSTLVASNDNWETGASTAVQISGASAQVGAFALTAGSKDAALLLTLQPGAYTVVVSGVNATTGVALVEVYDVK
jgi:hypothetical protein